MQKPGLLLRLASIKGEYAYTSTTHKEKFPA